MVQQLPIGAFAIAISAFVLPLRCVHGDFWSKVRRIDFLGSLLVLVGVVLMLLSLNWGGQAFSWSSAAVLATLLVGIAVMAAFVFWEGKGARLPIVPLHIFKNRTIVGVYITTVSLGVCFFIPLFYIPQVRRPWLRRPIETMRLMSVGCSSFRPPEDIRPCLQG